MAQDWQMPRRSEACVACGRAFDVGQTLRVYLFEVPAGYERRDFCETCSPEDEASAIGFWRTRRPAPQARKAAPFDRAAMMSFFERLSDADTPEKQQFRFVLGLLLWRRKALKLDHTKRIDDREVWRFSSISEEQTYLVVQPDLDEQRMEELSLQLEETLTGAGGPVDADGEPEPVHG